jgi:hypothetical protein
MRERRALMNTCSALIAVYFSGVDLHSIDRAPVYEIPSQQSHNLRPYSEWKPKPALCGTVSVTKPDSKSADVLWYAAATWPTDLIIGLAAFSAVDYSN